MALQKTNLAIPLALSIDTKTDPFQVKPGKCLSLVNAVFNKGGRIDKRSAFTVLATLPDSASATTLTTLKNNLTAIGTSLYAFDAPALSFENRGRIQSLDLSVQAVVRTSTSQTNIDAVVSPSGLVLVTFLDGDGNYKYQISDQSTGQQLAGPTLIPNSGTLPRAFVLGRYFIITYLVDVTATPNLVYIAIPLLNSLNPGPQTSLSNAVSGLTAGYDGYSENGTLFVAWANSTGGVNITRLDSNLVQHNTVTFAGHTATQMSVTVDNSQSTTVAWVSAYAANNVWTFAVNQNLVTVLGFTHSVTTNTIIALTSTATNGVLSLFYEISNTYSFSSVRSDFLRTVTVTQAGVVGTPKVIERSVGLASKAFLLGNTSYMLAVYAGAFQPTYFLIDGSGNVIARVAYANGSGYATSEILPSATVTGNLVQIGYLLKDLIASVNKSMNAPSVNNIYSQTGVNLVNFLFAQTNLVNVEVADALDIAGGFLWQYDGTLPVEQGFHLWPEDIGLTSDASGGSMTAQQYFYQATYEWTDAAGNINRSAPSIPQTITLTTDTEVILNIPTLRLTYKLAPNGVRIVIYRWSAGQQVFYQVTSISSPLLNNPAVDSVVYTDTQPDSAIVGNNILYTTGGVVEDIAGPATSIIALYGSRLFLVDSEDPNLLWYSKQVIEATPVEMSDLFTIFIPPTTGAQGSTGNITALSPMDDKLIIFKKNAIYYLTGIGPDNTGANNDFSNPVFITATVGCTNQKSIVFTPQGLMFQSDKGIWLLGRDLSTTYIGAPVEDFNNQPILSSVNVPEENQVRFTLETGTSSALYNGLHTVLNADGQVLQETPGNYLDGFLGQMLMFDYYFGQWGEFDVSSRPVLMSLVTSWFNLAGVQGFERAYFFYLLGTFLSPHKIAIDIAYDYNQSPTQSMVITPNNNSLAYGLDPYYGDGSPYGGPDSLEQWRIFLRQQKCQSFQISIAEQFDSTMATVPGAGLTLSHLNLVAGMKKGYSLNISAATSIS